MKTLIKNSINNLSKLKGSPFIGYTGVGARMRYLRANYKSTIAETIWSRLWVLAVLLVLTIGPLLLLIFKPNEINGGWFGKGVLFVTMVFCLSFLNREFSYVLNHRHIDLPHKFKA